MTSISSRDSFTPLAQNTFDSHVLLRSALTAQQVQGTDQSANLYWQSFYSRQKQQMPPSQFAAFVACEFKDHKLFMDIGCGNGRDSLFFSYQGHDVIGIDKSAAAIEFCQSQMISTPNLKSAFINADISELDLNSPLLKSAQPVPKIFYSRFFLHAIEENKENEMFEFIKQMGVHARDMVALEFRTEEDSNNPKLAQAHFRRFINPGQLVSKLKDRFGFEILYQVQGYGMAKYATEDAHVCRIIARVNAQTS
jgi:SAM-dependent methyltransferase